MSQVTATSSVPVVQENGDFKVINKSVIILRRFLRNKAAVFGLCVFIGMGLFGLFGKYLTKYKPNDIDIMANTSLPAMVVPNQCSAEGPSPSAM